MFLKKRTYSNDALACNSCDKSFSVKSALHQHVESVHEGNGFKCDICKKKFSARSSMVQHIDSVHEGRNNNISPNEASENKESDQRENINYKCNYCEKTFPIESSLKQHVEFVHDGNKCFECDICDIKYSRRSSLFQHFESVHEQNVNSEAHENLETKTEDIKITIGNIEYGKTEYSCTICKKTYKGRHTFIKS